MERCRFCNCVKSREFFENIFVNKQTDPTIPTIVELFTNLKIVEDDPYTKFVCFNCFRILIVFYHYRKRILETNQLLQNKTENNQNNVEDFHKNWPRIERCDDGQFVVYKNDFDDDCRTDLRIGNDSEDENNQCRSSFIVDNKKITNNNNNNSNGNLHENSSSNIVGNEPNNDELCLRISNNNNNSNQLTIRINTDIFLEIEFDDEDQTNDKNDQLSNISSDNDWLTTIDNDNKNCNDNDKQQLIKNGLCSEESLGFIINEIKTEETCLKIENDFNDDQDQQIYENNHHPSTPSGDDDDDDNDNEAVINDNQILGNKDSDRCCFDIIKDESNIEEFSSKIGSDSEDEDNQCLSTLIGDKKKKTNNYNNDDLCSKFVAGSYENPGAHKNNRFPNKSIDDVENNKKVNNSNNSSDKDNNNIMMLNEQQTCRKQRYQCNICNKNLSTKSILRKHLLRHTAEKRCKCNICGKKFTTTSVLKRHSLIHTGEKAHQCNICDMKFTYKGDLKRHLNIHTGERPYQCDVCNKGFKQKGTLKIHLLQHTGEKPYQCDICNNRFTRKGHLTDHLKIHTGEKPHQCNICDKKFRYKVHLRGHLTQHTDEKT